MISKSFVNMSALLVVEYELRGLKTRGFTEIFKS